MASSIDLRRFREFAAIGVLSVLIVGCPDPSPPVPDDDVFGCSGGTGGDDEFGLPHEKSRSAPSFEEYLSEHVVEFGEGWIIEGDIVVSDHALVEQAYINAIGGSSQHSAGFRATVGCDPAFGVDALLDPAQKLMMSYCFDETWTDRSELRALARAGIANAAAKWETASDINFVEVDMDPLDCDDDRGEIDFMVKYIEPCTPETLFCYNAMATFPNTTGLTRALRLRATTFDSPEKSDRILTHELGHFLGLWHEHQRYPQESGPCSVTIVADPDRTRGVTRADPDSVMGYPQCAGTNPQPPHPSLLDLVAIEYLYGLPRSEASASNRLVWHHPTSAERTVWTRTSAPNQSFQHTTTKACWLEDCHDLGSNHWRPFVLDIDGNPAPDVFMYGPGAIEEQIHTNIGGPGQTSLRELLSTENAAVPWIADEILEAGSTALWWQRPGLAQESIWQFMGPDEISAIPLDELPTHGGLFLATAGHFNSNDALQIYWWSPLESKSYLSRWTNDTMLIDVVYYQACGLIADTYYNRLPGDFDTDPDDEIFWYDPHSGSALLWSSVPDCLSGPLSLSQWGRGKPLVGRFSDDGLDDIVLYRPEQSLVTYFDGGSEQTWTRPLTGDTSPHVVDLNGDGCSDILWYAPEQSSSRFWRSDCAGDFTQEPPLATPRGYPLGYGSGHGRLPLRSH